MSTDAMGLTEVAARPLPLRLHEWVTTVDHKRLGILYVLYALVFLLIGCGSYHHARAIDAAA
jgi:cytochrome c oxidase subunit 1